MAEAAKDAPVETEEEKAEREKREAEKRKELEDIDIKSGDYQVQVHIIEARDLKAENIDGMYETSIWFIEVLPLTVFSVILSSDSRHFGSNSLRGVLWPETKHRNEVRCDHLCV